MFVCVAIYIKLKNFCKKSAGNLHTMIIHYKSMHVCIQNQNAFKEIY